MCGDLLGQLPCQLMQPPATDVASTMCHVACCTARDHAYAAARWISVQPLSAKQTADWVQGKVACNGRQLCKGPCTA